MWLPEDRDIVAVWQVEQVGRCPDCGTFGWEWEEYDQPWHPEHFTCYSCKAMADYKRGLGNVTDGTKYTMTRRARS